MTEDEVEMLRNFLHQLSGKKEDGISQEVFVQLLQHGAPKPGAVGNQNVMLAKKVSLGGGDLGLAQ